MDLFSVIGINYQSADFEMRNEFALNETQQHELLATLKDHGYEASMVLSTCNRTEIFTFCENPEEILNIWLSTVKQESADKKSIFYMHRSIDAHRHLCTVTSGAASQIPGDYEIVSQVKKAFRQSQKLGYSNGRLEKIVNTAIRVSKRVKTETQFSTGTSSVSYAVARKIKRSQITALDKILIIGLGKMGAACTRHLKTLMPQAEIMVMNRSEDKARSLALELEIEHVPFTGLSDSIDATHVVLATQAQSDILLTDHFENSKEYQVYDMTMPSNVQDGVGDLSNVHLMNIDEISQEVNHNLKKRIEDLPAVEKIIEKELVEMGKWWQIKQVLTSAGSHSEAKPFIDTIRKKQTTAEELFIQKPAGLR